jgi:hypothetical protein
MSNYAIELSVFDLLEETVLQYQKEAAMGIGEQLIDEMPVDTGRARTNVFISAQEDSNQQYAPYVPYKKGSGPNKDETGNRSAAKARLKQSAERIKAFDTVFIVNNATGSGGEYYYAGDLDKGSSAQTPAGMVDRSIAFGLMKADIIIGAKR